MASDVFALGGIIHWLCTGQHPPLVAHPSSRHAQSQSQSSLALPQLLNSSTSPGLPSLPINPFAPTMPSNSSNAEEAALQTLIQKCRSVSPSDRPPLLSVVLQLQQAIVRYCMPRNLPLPPPAALSASLSLHLPRTSINSPQGIRSSLRMEDDETHGVNGTTYPTNPSYPNASTSSHAHHQHTTHSSTSSSQAQAFHTGSTNNYSPSSTSSSLSANSGSNGLGKQSGPSGGGSVKRKKSPLEVLSEVASQVACTPRPVPGPTLAPIRSNLSTRPKTQPKANRSHQVNVPSEDGMDLDVTLKFEAHRAPRSAHPYHMSQPHTHPRHNIHLHQNQQSQDSQQYNAGEADLWNGGSVHALSKDGSLHRNRTV